MQHDPDEKFQQLPGYKIDRKRRLGKGAFGQVFVGSKIGNPQQYAIKIIQIKNAQNIDNIKKTQVECLKNFNHQNIIKIIHHYYNQLYFYIVFEKCDYSLQSLIDAKNFYNKKLTDNQCFYILFQICQAFKEISSKNCIHRYLKPANILMKDGKVKIADFGLVTENKDKISKKQTTCGTSLYFPPELLQNMEGKNQYSQKYDVWALGCIAYQLFIGSLPWINIGAEIKKMIFNGYKQMKGIENIPQINIKQNPPSFQALKFMNSTLTLDSKKRKNWQELLKILDQDKKQFLFGLQQKIKDQFRSIINNYKEEAKSKNKNSTSKAFGTNQSNSQKKSEKVSIKQENSPKKTEKITNYTNQKNQSQQLWLNKVLKQSSILNQDKAVLLLMSWIPNASKIELVFKASNNEFQLKKYYEICGDLQNTIIIVKTTKGKIFGGYTPLSFNPSFFLIFSDNQDIKDGSNSSFVFSLSEKQKFQLIEKNKNAITTYKAKSFIAFIDTLYIYDNSNTKNKYNNIYNWFSLSRNDYYNTSKYHPDSKQNYLKITGQIDRWFLTQQYQVYQVFFQ